MTFSEGYVDYFVALNVVHNHIAKAPKNHENVKGKLFFLFFIRFSSVFKIQECLRCKISIYLTEKIGYFLFWVSSKEHKADGLS